MHRNWLILFLHLNKINEYISFYSVYRYRFNATLHEAGRRNKQRHAAEALNKMEPEELKSILGSISLPSWLTSPDFERVRWVNRVVDQLFPHIAKYSEGWARGNVDDLLHESSPRWIRSINMTRVSAGAVPPRVTGVKVFSSEDLEGDEEIVIELDVRWNSDAELGITVLPIPKAKIPFLRGRAVVDQLVNALTRFILVKVSVEKVTLRGKVRVELRPLMSAPPLIGSAQIALSEIPDFNFELKLWNGNSSVLPGLESWLYTTIKDSVLRQYTLPERYILPFIPKDQLAGDKPRGVLEIEVIEAEHVPWMDLFSPSDPYVKVFTRVGRQVSTQVIQNTTKPQWDEKFLLLVHHPDIQELTAILTDYDIFNQDDEIGRVEINIKDLPRGETVDKWYEVHRAGKEKKKKDGGNGGNELKRGVEQMQRVAARAISPAVSSRLQGGGRLHKPCRLHLRMTYVDFSKEEVDKATKGHLEGGRGEESVAIARQLGLSPALQRIVGGGVLYVRIRTATDIDFSQKMMILGGWKHKVKIKVIFGGKEKSTPILTARGRQLLQRAYNFDSELEFVLDSEEAERAKEIKFEVWDVHWKNAFLGAAELPFDAIRRRRTTIESLELKGAERGRVEVRCQWVGLLNSDG